MMRYDISELYDVKFYTQTRVNMNEILHMSYELYKVYNMLRTYIGTSSGTCKVKKFSGTPRYFHQNAWLPNNELNNKRTY